MTRGAETKQQTARRFVGRVTLVTVFFGIVASSLVARAVYLQVLDKDFLNQQADTRHLRTEKISAHRGTISDRSIPKLARALGVDSQMLMRRITRSMDKEFLYLKRHLSPEQAKEVLDLKLPGVNVQREYRRYYPASEVTGHLIGFTDIDDEGQEGLELAFNHWLAGESGAKRVLKDRLGRSIENVASIRPPHHGKDLRTSIDLRLQYLAAVSCLSHAQSRNQDAQCPFGFDRRARRQDRRSAGDGQPAHLQPE
jgi:cell division protein FtsI (penicillin-binding protein 3)